MPAVPVAEPLLMLWLFVKNWMFCTVNAIMFDMKDYEDDANIELKTFAVRMGLRNTIYYILVPLLLMPTQTGEHFGMHLALEKPASEALSGGVDLVLGVTGQEVGDKPLLEQVTAAPGSERISGNQ